MSYSKKFLLSLVLHILLYLCIVLYWQTMQFTWEGEEGQSTESKQITAYLYQEIVQEPKPTTETSPQLAEIPQDIVLSPTKKFDQIQEQEISNIDSPKKSGEIDASAQHKDLVMLLHTAIKHKQRYPQSALHMGRQGRATVHFTLYPDGSIDHLRIMNSSGTASLDTAALAAVESAAPFVGIDAYLSASEAFKIDVVFALRRGDE